MSSLAILRLQDLYIGESELHWNSLFMASLLWAVSSWNNLYWDKSSFLLVSFSAVFIPLRQGLMLLLSRALLHAFMYQLMNAFDEQLFVWNCHCWVNSIRCVVTRWISIFHSCIIQLWIRSRIRIGSGIFYEFAIIAGDVWI